MLRCSGKFRVLALPLGHAARAAAKAAGRHAEPPVAPLGLGHAARASWCKLSCPGGFHSPLRWALHARPDWRELPRASSLFFSVSAGPTCPVEASPDEDGRTGAETPSWPSRPSRAPRPCACSVSPVAPLPSRWAHGPRCVGSATSYCYFAARPARVSCCDGGRRISLPCSF